MKMKYGLLMLLILCIVMPWAAAEGETEMGTYGGGEYAIAPEDVPTERLKAWDAYRASMLADGEVRREAEEKALRFGDAVMRYTLAVVGEKPEDGYPLYIALHGGGAADTPDVNDEQWKQMQGYYKMPLRCGVYVAVRGVRDTWDTHFNPESYPLYDRLIALMILTEDVDPNRVYLEGFSAGGDGKRREVRRDVPAEAALGHQDGARTFPQHRAGKGRK